LSRLGISGASVTQEVALDPELVHWLFPWPRDRHPGYVSVTKAIPNTKARRIGFCCALLIVGRVRSFLFVVVVSLKPTL
jgi:hypothetical protein